MPEHHVPRRVVDGRGEVHVQLVHRGLSLAQEGEGDAQAVVQGRGEVDAHLGQGHVQPLLHHLQRVLQLAGQLLHRREVTVGGDHGLALDEDLDGARVVVVGEQLLQPLVRFVLKISTCIK